MHINDIIKYINIYNINNLYVLIFLLVLITIITKNRLFIVIILFLFYFLSIREDFKMDAPPNYRNNLLTQNKKARDKMALNPLIAPRSHDREVWSFPSYRHSAVNYNSMNYDITNDYNDITQQPEEDIDIDESKYTGNLLVNEESETPIENIIDNNKNLKSILKRNNANDKYESKERFQAQPHLKNEINETPLNKLPVFTKNDFLIPKTIPQVYGRDAITNNDRYKYMTNVQPNIYSYSDVAEPINANLGISYTPSIPPLVRDQVATPNGTYPLYHRVDPQLIRDQNISKERMEELPRRNAWSAKYSNFDAQSGTVNFEDIYDPRFNGTGDDWRAYGDVNLGQIQYYYSDIDAYRNPNYSTRSKVDFIDYVDPMGKVIPEYTRNVGLDDVRANVNNQFDADAMYFREGLQERLMRKRNSELWQLRKNPIRNNANVGSFTSNY